MAILFITSNRIGDAILSSGLLSHLEKKYPTESFTIVAGPSALPFFEGFPRLDSLIPFPKEKRGKHWFKLWLKTFWRPWSLVVDLRGSLVSYFLITKERKVWRPLKNDTLHRVEEIARLANIAPPPSPTIWLLPSHREKIQKILGKSSFPILALGVGANWQGKIWPISSFINLVKKLCDPKEGILPNVRILLLGSADEKKYALPFFEAFSKEEVIDAFGLLSLPETAACLEKSSLFIGNDSGLMHLAAASHIPTLGLFGPSRPEHYRPWGEKTSFVTTSIPYEQLVWVTSDYDPKTTSSLMESLTVDTVEKAAVSLYSKNKYSSK